ncbi:C4-dicarboxylate ABC transporter substrate-binding protein [Thioclava marina]|uniref:C4-dicarboxylate ABC transporter substrate-binding protein n=2 Tax=Paracoccaceae TaxID=31989 RepID=A0ABX3MJ20_9RHOB|nr:C4-dicarboxylate ABC transporter substrate-binding protein [Thioclava marina]OOY27074.1 C4-dicarboxylate ABC transporter substrate-binding protein [Thioclava sp. L04-15]TNE83141.1 MAG: DctP family TRAP transporter solute-binding subunit [Paracoccaceae bacterium]
MKFAATTLAAACMAFQAQAADITIRLAHLNPEDPFGSHSGAMAAVFKSIVESNSGGRIEVQLFPNGQLGKDNEVIDQVRNGLVESVISSSGGIAQHYPLVGVFDIPFAFPNIGVASKVITKDSSFGKKFTADLEAKTGLKVLGLLDSGGFFEFTNSKKPIKTVEDMAGLRIRTMTVPTQEALVNSLGANATPMPWAELYTALQTGVVDGEMNPVPIIAFAKFDEVQKYLSLTNHLITPYVWTMNEDFYKGLSPEDQYLISWAADVATDAGRSMSRVIEASDKGLPALAAKMEVNAVDPAELEKFAAASQPAVRALIEEKFGAEGTEMLDAMMTSINEEKTDF